MPSPQGSSRKLYVRLLGYVRPYWRVFALSILTMALAAATEPVLPALMKPLLDGSFVERNQTHPYLVPLAIIGILRRAKQTGRSDVRPRRHYGQLHAGRPLIVDRHSDRQRISRGEQLSRRRGFHEHAGSGEQCGLRARLAPYPTEPRNRQRALPP